jgi:hypothetical protein
VRSAKSSYFGLDESCHFEARVESDKCSVYTVHCTLFRGGRDYVTNSGTLASTNRQNTACPKYNDDISLLILQYLLSGMTIPHTLDSGNIKNKCIATAGGFLGQR